MCHIVEPSLGRASGADCTWQRRLCVTCRVDADGVTRIRVQTNNLPNHCVQSIQLKEQDLVEPQGLDMVWGILDTSHEKMDP